MVNSVFCESNEQNEKTQITILGKKIKICGKRFPYVTKLVCTPGFVTFMEAENTEERHISDDLVQKCCEKECAIADLVPFCQAEDVRF